MNYKNLVVDIERMIGLLKEKSIPSEHIANLEWLRDKYNDLGTKVTRKDPKGSGD